MLSKLQVLLGKAHGNGLSRGVGGDSGGRPCLVTLDEPHGHDDDGDEGHGADDDTDDHADLGSAAGGEVVAERVALHALNAAEGGDAGLAAVDALDASEAPEGVARGTGGAVGPAGADVTVGQAGGA